MDGFTKFWPDIASDGNRRGIDADLFGRKIDKSSYERMIDNPIPATMSTMHVKKVKVEIFDLSDKKQVKAYERLWAKLNEMTFSQYNGGNSPRVVIDSRKDLVHRADGTSYWMKYVEYIEFEEIKGVPDNLASK